jgi:hypothetical protein
MLTGRTGQTIRTLKSIRSFHSYVPAVRRTRSTDRHAPCALPTAEGVLKLYGNLPAQASIPEILQLNRDSHLMGILSKGACPSTVQTGQVRAGCVSRLFVNSVIHNSC